MIAIEFLRFNNLLGYVHQSNQPVQLMNQNGSEAEPLPARLGFLQI